MKAFWISLAITVLFLVGAVFLSSPGSDTEIPATNNVRVVDGKQIVEITAKGGYSPRVVAAKADMPTVLRVETKNTFDCSAALTIPQVGYRQILDPSGTTDIDLPPQKPGSVVRGLCSMGMYNFQVRFE